MHLEFNETDCQFVHVNSLRLRIFDKGEGKPLLLLHGFPDDLTVWKKIVPLLVQAGYRVIAFDQRGFGESDMLESKQDYRISSIVSDIPALLDSLSIKEPVFVMGHDWGAVIAWAFSLAYPERIRASVNISVGHPESYRRSGVSQKILKGFYTLWFQLNGLAEFYLENGGLKRWLGRHPEPNVAIEKMLRPGRLRAGLTWYRANLSRILFQRWPNCKVPTLSVWSVWDDYLTQKQVLNSQKYMSAEWAYYEMECTGHWIPLEKPELLSEKVINWFQQY